MTMTTRRMIRSPKIFMLSATALGALAFGATAPAYGQQTEETVAFDIPAQNLSQALKSYGVAVDRQVMFDADLVRGKQANAIQGELAVDEALDKLLTDSGLVYETTDSDIVVIKTAQQEALRNRSLMLVAQVLDGENDDAPQQTNEEPLEVDTIIVTGTNIRGLENPTTPMLRFDRQDIELSGAATVQDFIRTIPQNFNSTTPLSDNSGNPFNERSETDATTIDLRGLGAGSTLVLLNGRRMAASGSNSFVDVSALPLSAIERVDVLTDGASAVYGSDAVAGVVNFITRRDYEGVEVRGRYGTVTSGSLEDYQVGIAGGTAWNSGGLTGSIEYQEQTPLLIGERDFTDPAIANPEGTFGPDNTLFSATASFNQELVGGLIFATDALYSRRESESVSAEVGAIGDAQAFRQTEVDALFINSRFEYEISNDLNATVYFDYGREGSTRDNSAQSGVTNTERTNEILIAEAKLDGTLLSLPGGNVSFAIGSMFRQENFYLDLSDGALIIDADRDVFAAYAEVLVPIVNENQSVPFLKQFDLSLAGRFEDYSDFGSTFNPRVGVHFVPATGLSIRGSYSESFRAPPLADLFSEQQQSFVPLPTFLLANAPIPPQDDRLAPGTAATNIVGGGNPNLTQETAEIWTAGFDYRPTFFDGFEITGTFFDIDYSDRIEFVSPFDIFQIPELSVLLIAQPDPTLVEQRLALRDDPTVATVYGLPFEATGNDIDFIVLSGSQNVSQRSVSGFDFGLSQTLNTNAGTFSGFVNATYIMNYAVRLSEISDAIEQVDLVYQPVDLRLRGGVSWSYNNFTSALNINYTDSYRDSLIDEIANDISSFTTVDLAITYNVGDDIGLLSDTQLSVAVQNVFDEDPPFAQTIDGLNFDSANGDPRGRYIGFAAVKRF